MDFHKLLRGNLASFASTPKHESTGPGTDALRAQLGWQPKHKQAQVEEPIPIPLADIGQTRAYIAHRA